MPRGRLKTPLAKRLWAKVDKSGDCWIWTGRCEKPGYGRIGLGYSGKLSNQQTTTHAAAYRLLVGEIPPGLHLDHLCRNRACCNPNHLEPVTPRENVRRGIAPPALNAKLTHCPQGHPYSGDNLTIGHRGDGSTFRVCKACSVRFKREYKRRSRKCDEENYRVNGFVEGAEDVA